MFEREVKKSSKVSVITLTNKRDDTLIRAIESVKNQNYDGEIEHILVNDGNLFVNSKKSSLLEAYPFLRIIDVDISTYKGEFHSLYIPSRISLLRNIGIDKCSGYLICQLGDDDYYLPNHINSLVNTLIANPDAGVAYSWRYLVHSDGSPCVEPFYPWSSAYPRLSTSGVALSKYVYERLVVSGIRDVNSNIVKDMVLTSEGEPVYTVDTNELMVRRDVHRLIPFRVKFNWRQMIEDYSEDYCFVKECHEFGILFACSSEATLVYTIGGFSNNQRLWAEKK
ncbi:glycosyltransferase family 2 protein [Chlorobaculum thiosulfatiphilum]|uniref:Glycosyltransferase family 2 protein n=1 Tax=Chlorobaculum thiosulfatiphilum TaxID=115852 RepID=A0A5C4S067_CHLTI|nr:glycosyltransferase family A protein [Chlorobaculum thiosulfatiphilum]TNJ36271.1 glycosyltransferase family 2 protein [Chlorobaculum thiosulfatiphilum]